TGGPSVIEFSNLFNTPDQGKRLKGLISGITSEYSWRYSLPHDRSSHPYRTKFLLSRDQPVPAFTLQELINIVYNHPNKAVFNFDKEWLAIMEIIVKKGAKELADLIIEKLEAQA